MLLAVDIGNTRISLGVFRSQRAGGKSAGTVGEGPADYWRLATSVGRTGDEYALSIHELLASSGYAESDITGAILCSVVPRVTATVASAVERCIGAPPVVLADGEAAGVAAGMPVRTDSPSEIGADRVVGAAAAFGICGGPVVVVDMGTAITVDLVSGEGEFRGGAIAPGMRLSAAALHAGTAMLPMTEPARPERAVGRNTTESLISGLYHGFTGLVDGLITAVSKEAGPGVRVVATGGDAALVCGNIPNVTLLDEYLTLKGLKFIFDRI